MSQAQIIDLVFVNTPFNERCKGVMVKVDVLRIPADAAADDVRYVSDFLSYFDNGTDTLFNNCREVMI